MTKKISTPNGTPSASRGGAPAETAMRDIGGKGGSLVDRATRFPAQTANSVRDRATAARDQAAKATSEIAQDVATRLNPDSSDKAKHARKLPPKPKR